MIFVTVGTHYQVFNRLVQAMDELAATTDEHVIIQRGNSTYKPKYAEHFEWATSQQMESLTQEARVVVGHGGSGTIIVTLLKGKPLVLVPRSKYFGEHGDDHQQQLATALEEQGRVIVVQEPSVATLSLAIEQANEQQIKENGAKKLISALRQQLDLWDQCRRKPTREIG